MWRELEEGKERKMGEREKYNTSETQEGEVGGFPRQGLRLDQMQRTMGLMRLGGPEGKGREATQSGGYREVPVLREPRPWAPSWVCVGRGCLRTSARARGRHKVGGAVQIITPTANNNVIACDSRPGPGPSCIISCQPHSFLLTGLLFLFPFIL